MIDINKYIELTRNLFGVKNFCCNNTIESFSTFDPNQLKLVVDGKVVYGFYRRIEGNGYDFQIELQITSPWAMLFLRNSDAVLNTDICYKDCLLFTERMIITSQLHFNNDNVPSVSVRFKKK